MAKKSPPSWLLEAPLVLIVSLFGLPFVAKGIGYLGLKREYVILLSFILQQGGFILGTIYLKNKYPLYPDETIVFKPNWHQFFRSLLWLPAIFLLSIFAINISTQILTPIVGPEKLERILLRETTRVDLVLLESLGVFVSALLVCVVGPISEEFFFRGFFFSRMCATYSLKTAYLITSLFFALPHFYVINFLPIFLLSLVLCYIAQHEGLWGAIGAHVFFNSLVFISMILQITAS